MTSQTPEQIQAEQAELDEAVVEAVFEWTGALPSRPDAPGNLPEALAPALAAIRRHAAADALKQQADRLQKAVGSHLTRSEYDTAAGLRVAVRRLRTAADDVIAEGWEHTCSWEAPATREDPGYGCEEPVETEGDYCARHEPADDDRNDR